MKTINKTQKYQFNWLFHETTINLQDQLLISLHTTIQAEDTLISFKNIHLKRVPSLLFKIFDLEIVHFLVVNYEFIRINISYPFFFAMIFGNSKNLPLIIDKIDLAALLIETFVL